MSCRPKWYCLDVEGHRKCRGMRLAHSHPLRRLGQRDRGFTALRDATRTAIIMPGHVRIGRQGHRQPAGLVEGQRVAGWREALNELDTAYPGRERTEHLLSRALADRRDLMQERTDWADIAR
jgi:hypothetical protein